MRHQRRPIYVHTSDISLMASDGHKTSSFVSNDHYFFNQFQPPLGSTSPMASRNTSHLEVHSLPASPCQANASQFPPFLALPLELRHAVYRRYFESEDEACRIEVSSNYLDGSPPAKVKFYTTHDLSLLETNSQVRAEASEIFYAECIFTLKLRPRTQEYGQKPFYGIQSYQVDYSNIRKAHVLTSAGFYPVSLEDLIMSASRMRAFFEAIADTLTGSHCMRYLLLEAYEFEKFPFDMDNINTPWGLAEVLKPLEKVQGLQVCHIRAMSFSTWPYLRFLEKQITRNNYSLPRPDAYRSNVSARAMECKEILQVWGIANGFGDADLPCRPNIFEILQTEPLYLDVTFLDRVEDDILIQS